MRRTLTVGDHRNAGPANNHPAGSRAPPWPLAVATTARVRARLAPPTAPVLRHSGTPVDRSVAPRRIAPVIAKPPADPAAAPTTRSGRLRRSLADDRSALVIASGAGVASLAMNFWIPFLPLYMKELGASSDANALFWVSVATTGLGLGRLVSGPFWGVLSDRFGRKVMYVRALFFATATTLIAAIATEPWHVAAAYACQGLLSGFIPAAVALASVSVPESRLTNSLGIVTAAQYLGSTIGPAAGSGLALLFGFRGAIVAAAILPALAALLVYVIVPRDEAGAAAGDRSSAQAATSAPPWWKLFTFQFGLAMFLYFFLFAANQLIRTLTPVAIEEIAGHKATGAVGVAFTLSGLTSVIGVTLLARRFVRPGQIPVAVGAFCAAMAAAHILIAVSPGVPLYVTWFCVIAALQGAILPATNTLIAASVGRERRGTAFGLAGSAQALAFMVGPFAATAAAAASIEGGYLLLAALFLAVAALSAKAIRER